MLLPLLIGLGFWQLDRAEQKRQIQLTHAKHQAKIPVELNLPELDNYTSFTRIIAEGNFDNEHVWLIDNKQRQGKPGFEVVQPFLLASGGTFLVNRGWVAGLKLRTKLPEILMVEGSTIIFAEIMVPSMHPLLSAESTTNSWPKVITAITPSIMKKYLGVDLPSNYVRLDEASTGVLAAGWHVVATTEAKHIGYAIQWFAMAAALIVCFVVMNTNFTIWLRAKKH